MDVFHLNDRLLDDYSNYLRSFINVRDSKIAKLLDDAFVEKQLWPEALIQLNPSFESGGWIHSLVAEGLLHSECGSIFRRGKGLGVAGEDLRLHKHQVDAKELQRKMQIMFLLQEQVREKAWVTLSPLSIMC